MSVAVLGLGGGTSASLPVPGISTTDSAIVDPVSKVSLDSSTLRLVGEADIEGGTIGVVATGVTDDATDNVFHIHLEREPRPGDRVWLEYELNGVVDRSGVARSLNHAPVTCGVIVGRSSEWSDQREAVRPEDVTAGDNTLLFATRDADRCAYRIRNVRLVVEPGSRSERVVEVTSAIGSADGTATYISGFVTGPASDGAQVSIDGQEVLVMEGKFEWFAKGPLAKALLLQVVYPDGTTLEKAVRPSRSKGAELILPYEAPEPCAAVDVGPARPFALERGGASIAADSGVAEAPLRVSITPLRTVDLPPLPADLVNVTGQAKGFRFLPDGTVFQKPVALKLAFDPALLPAGYTPADIRSYFFDEVARKWRSVPLDSVLLGDSQIRSFTTHFTDYINAVIQVPESPETMGYTPTSIKDFKAGDVSAGITPLVPPVATNTGAATTRFPLKLPQGRQRMQPELAIQYNSEGGNGWMGVGWDLSTPSISIETRWGVPRYDLNKETETYLLDGEMLSPVAHRTAWVDRNTSGDKTFHTRVEGSFRRIRRKQHAPAEYWWEVTEKNGTKKFYGGDGTNVVENAVLRTTTSGTSPIAKWMLYKEVDSNGNTVTYTYETVEHSGAAGSPNIGRQIYPKRIRYTGSDNGGDGPYEVAFVFDDTTRADKQVNCRLGFKEVTANLLERIAVKYNSDTIRSYHLYYSEGAFKKKLLDSIVEYDAAGARFYGHGMVYYDDVRVGNAYVPYETQPSAWAVPSVPGLGGPLVNITGLLNNEPTSINGSETSNFGYGGAITVGPAVGGLSSKANTIGGNYYRSRGSGESTLSLVDVNGDNLPDRLFRRLNGFVPELEYQPNLLGSMGTFAFGEAVPLSTLPSPSFGKTKTTSTTKGLEAHPLVAYIGVNWSSSEVTTKNYLLDRNGDGLMDVAQDRIVRYNHLEQGVPSFTTSSSMTENPISGGLLSDDIEPYDPGLVPQLIEENPLHDVVSVWVAPYQGHVNVQGTIKLIEDLSMEAELYGHQDGVRASIQVNSDAPVELVIPWDLAEDFQDFPENNSLNGIQVLKDDRIYFRLHSRFDGAYDKVIWDRSVEYVDTQNPGGFSGDDANEHNLLMFDAQNDYLLSGAHSILTPDTGVFWITGQFSTPPLSDTVELRVSVIDPVDFNTTVVYSQTVPANTAVPDLGTIMPPLALDTGGYAIAITVHALTNVQWQAIEWSPTVHFVSDENDTTVFDPMVGFTMFNYVQSTTDNFGIRYSRPSRPILGQDTVTVNVEPLIGNVTCVTCTPPQAATITLSCKGRGRLVDRQRFNYDNGIITPLDPEMSFVTYPDSTYYLEYHVDNRLVADSLVILAVDVSYSTFGADNTWGNVDDDFGTALGVHTAPQPQDLLFGEQFRSWGRFIYRGNDTVEASINEALLEQELQQYQDDAGIVGGVGTGAQLQAAQISSYDPTLREVLYMSASRDRNAYIGFDDLIYMTADSVSSSRMGEDDLSYAGDVVQDEALTYVPNKVSKGSNEGASTSIGYSVFNAGFGASTGSDRAIVDVIDLNGDRYPDNVGETHIQMTRPTGELDPIAVAHGFLETHLSRSSAEGFSTGGSCPTSKSSNTNKPQSINEKVKAAFGLEKIQKNAEKSTGTAKASISISFSGNWNRDTTITTWQDMNGDGLQDRVMEDGSVSLNLGYGFLPPENWGNDGVRSGSSNDFSLGTGISVNNGSIQFGLGGSWTNNRSLRGLMDVNGDGLADRVYTDGDDDHVAQVALNLGAGFGEPVNWPANVQLDRGYSAGESLNGAFTVCVPIFWVAKLCFNPSLNAGIGLSRTETQWTDMTGDGYPDYLVSNGSGDLSVWRCRIGRTNLLKEARGPFGTSFTVDYEIAGNTYELPQSKWVMKSMAFYDGYTGDGPDSTYTTFEYADGQYDRRERETYGFGTVRTKEWDTQSTSDEPYRTTVQTYDVSGYYTKGLPLNKTVYAGTSTKYTETVNTYELHGEDGNTLPSGFNANDDSAWAFPALVRTDDLFYEGLPAPPGMHRAVTYEYDPIGNATRYTDLGNVDNDDVVTAEIDYWSYPVPYIMGEPKEVEIKVDGNTVRHRSQLVDEATGNVTEIKQKIDGATDAVYNLFYEDNGNLTRIQRPANHLGERMSYDYQYDTSVTTYVTKVTDAYHYYSTSAYEYLFGQVTETSDINKQVTRYHVDDKGRVDRVTGPYEVAANLPYTITIDYHPDAQHPYSRVAHYDPEHPGTDIETYTYLDGLFRPIQVRKSAELASDANGGTAQRQIVSGRILYDAFGRALKEYHPIRTTAIPQADSIVSGAASYFTKTTYDILDRKDSVMLPDGAVTWTAYGFEDDAYLTTVTDANGNIKKSLTDIRGRNVARKDYGPGEIVTRFRYNGVGDLLDVTDAGNNITAYTYDLLGRKLTYDHPDGGLTKYTYDPAGNLTEKLTGNLLEWWPDVSGPIKYTYQYERPVRIDYPRNYQNQVTYAYGDTTAGFNRIGRVVLQQDATGGQEFFYGPLGEVEKTIRTIVVSQGDIRTYISEQKYDTWNRVRWMAYPDGEVVNYYYNKGGLLESMNSEKNGFQYPIIDKITYDAFEQRTYLKQGNGVVTKYKYELDRRRLDTLSVKTPDDGYIMQNAYSYDAVNNVLSLANSRDVPTGGLGGSMVSTYAYDSLYRLVSANGDYTGDGREDDYELTMAYDDLHNITSKTQQHHSTFPWQVESTYANTYTYDGSKPHAPTRIGERDHTYDANGNLTGWVRPIVPTPTHREIAWDEENRMQALNDDGYISQFTYDASGERVLKSHGGMQSAFVNGAPVGFVQHRENYSIYVSPYLVVNEQGFTKHYYSEGQRVASRLGTGTFHQGLWPTTLQAGGLDYAARVLLLQQAAQGQYQAQGLPPGPPTMPNYYGQPPQGGAPLEVGPVANTQIPPPSSGWPQPPLVTNPNGVPGPPTVPLQTTTRDSVHAGYGFTNESNQAEPNRYFYHPDHLGSSSYITDAFGHVRQHIEYMAFGETFLEEHTNSETQPYLYNGKELDRETGLYYYGARYYDPVASMWASVDPMAHKLPEWGPYHAMKLNPINVIDPDGGWTFWVHNKIIDQAFDDILSPEEISTLKEANWHADFKDGAQGSNLANEHYMSIPGQSVSEAEQGSELYVLEKKFEYSFKEGHEGLFALGEGMHTIMDKYAPGHEGSQEWDFSWSKPSTWGDGLLHLLGDMNIFGESNDRVDMAAKALREYYEDSKSFKEQFAVPSRLPSKGGSTDLRDRPCSSKCHEME